MQIRTWKKEADYPRAEEWWKAHRCAEDYIPLPQYLPRSGFVVEDDAGIPLCMGWLFVFMDVPGAQLGYIVTNPENTPGVSLASVSALIHKVNRIADEQGWRMVARYDHEPILNLLKGAGWQELVRGQVEMIRYPEVKS